MKLIELLTEKRVESTWISSLTHNRPNKVLTMKLSNGKVFTIPNITRTTFERWTKSPSKGHFWHESIKNKFKATRIR